MNSRVSSGLTACVAVAAAGVVAITPVATPTPTRLVDAQTALMGATYTQLQQMDQGELAVEFGVRVAEQFAQAPLLPLVLAAQVGDPDRLYVQIRQVIDAPLYVSDPLIEIARDTLPDELGGGEAAKAWRDTEFWAATDAARTQVAEALGVDANQDYNYAFKLVEGLVGSGINMASLPVRGVLGLIPLAQALTANDGNVSLYNAIREYTDAPLWAADPAIEGIADALPTELGGGTNHNPKTSESVNGSGPDGPIMEFRNKTLWGATRDTRVAIADALGVPVDTNGDVDEDPETDNSSLQRNSVQVGSSKVNNLKPHVTSVNTALNNAKDKAKERRAKAKANVDNAVKKAQTAVKNVTKKLSPKKASSDSED